MDLGSIAAKMTLNIANFTSQLELAESQAVKMAQKTSKAVNIGDSLTQVGKTATKALTVPLLALAGAAIKIGNDFEYQMDRVGAIAGATTGELKKMSDQAIKLGADTSFSAKEAAEGMENLASAGFSASEIMSAMAGVLDLAAVSGGDVSLASEAMATSLRAFGLEASDAGHVADIFAKAAADTNAEASDMAEAMKYIAPVAHAMGISIEETAAAVGLLSDAGIKGSQAGTTLRGALSRLSKPTKLMKASMDELGISFFDAQGNMLPLRDQIAMLQDATAGLTQEEKNRHLVTLYGQESLSGMLALIDAGPEKLENLTTALQNSDGAAKDMADQMMGNTKMAIEEMLGAFESVAIIVQQILAPAVSAVANALGSLADRFVNASPLAQKMIVIFAAMVAALGPLLVIIGTVITTVAKMKIAFSILGKTALTMTGWIGIVIAAIYALVAVFMIAYTNSETFRNIINSLIPVLKAGLSAALEFTVIALQKLWEILKVVGAWLRDQFGVALEYVKAQLEKVGPQLSAFADAFKKLLGAGIEKLVGWLGQLRDILGGALGTAIQFISTQMDNMGGAFGKIGTIAGILAGMLAKIGIAVLGLTGPWGTLASVVATFLIMWAKTGELNADGITQVFDNINSTIESAANIISTYLPKFIEIGMNVLMKLVEGIVAAMPSVVNVIVQLITVITETIVTVLPMILEVGLTIILALIEGIVAALPQLVTAFITVLEFIVQAIVTALPLIVNVGVQILTTLIDGIVMALPQIIGAILLVITTLVTMIVQMLPMIISAGIQILMALISGIIQIIPTLISTALTVITALLNALITLLPMIISAGVEILLALVGGLISMIPTLLQAALQIITSLLTAILQFLPQLLAAGVQLLLALIKGIVQILPQLISAALRLMGQLLLTLLKFLPKLLSAGAQLILALVRGVLSILGTLIGAALKLGGQLLSSLLGFAGRMLSAGVTLIVKFISGIGQKIGSAVSKGKELGNRVVTSVSGFAGKMASAAKDMVQGFINGIGEKIGGVVSKAKELASSAVNTVKSFLNINSPSRLMMQMGRYTGEGFVNGIGNMVGKAKNVAQEMAKTVSDNMSDIQLDLPENSMLSSIRGTMDKVKSSLGANIPMPELALAASAAGTLVDDYPDTGARKPEPTKPEPTKPNNNNEPSSPVYIDTIVVRDDKDLDDLTQGLYNNSKEKLVAMGDTKKRD